MGMVGSQQTSFNGASVFQPRKDANANTIDVTAPASMGPRFFNRGKVNLISQSGPVRFASMGPRFFNRGKTGRCLGTCRRILASMGPRFFNRGKRCISEGGRSGICRFNGASVFQPRKAPAYGCVPTCRRSLQWGLGFSTEESSTATTQPNSARRASMGPRFFNRGKTIRDWRLCQLPRRLQWGLGFSTEERSDGSFGKITVIRKLQWGLGFSTEES